ncbi:hypothetical protein [Prevotella ihumii]|uniref:hypothetical protein n=1 Tax=Prevotella ihumii TaxID=1917878 RepID=UPI001180704E|nr:hypothetical protein [Prevotella ihumii]
MLFLSDGSDKSDRSDGSDWSDWSDNSKFLIVNSLYIAPCVVAYALGARITIAEQREGFGR